MSLSRDAQTVWTAACVVRGQLEHGAPLSVIRADLRTVSMQHRNPNLAAIAGAACRAQPFMHEWIGEGEVIPLR